MHEIIQLGESTVVVLKDGLETSGQFCLCEMKVNARTLRPFPHRHITFDQTVVGMDGLMVWSLGGEQIVIGPGERLFIPRGTAHGFLNRHTYPARFLCVYSPAVITQQFFEQLREVEQGDAEDRRERRDAVLGRFDTEQVPTSRSEQAESTRRVVRAVH